MDLIGNNPITAAGTYRLPVAPGQRYAFSAVSASWVGTMTVGWEGANGSIVAFEESPLAISGGFEFVCPGGAISITTSDAMTVYVATVPVK